MFSYWRKLEYRSAWLKWARPGPRSYAERVRWIIKEERGLVRVQGVIDASWQMGQVLEDVYMQKRIHSPFRRSARRWESLMKPPKHITRIIDKLGARNLTHAAIISKHAAISGDN
jgi:hypothetical protein